MSSGSQLPGFHANVRPSIFVNLVAFEYTHPLCRGRHEKP